MDAVVTWVDGNDPVHRERKKARKESLLNMPDKEATADVRFLSNDEIRYCLRSIYNYAPWIDRVFLVTDRQYPDSINKYVAEKHGIYQIDHSEIFSGYKSYLPTFSSRSIETMMPNIQGLSESFMHICDDYFFTGRVDRDFFYSLNGLPKVYGTLKEIPTEIDSLYVHHLVNAAKLISPDAKYYIWPEHYMKPLSKRVLRQIMQDHGDKYFANASYPFRDKNQFKPTVAVQNYLHSHENVKVRKMSKFFSLEISEGAGKKKLKYYRTKKYLLENNFIKVCCINDWANAETKMPGIIKCLKNATGPMAPFEYS